MCALGLWLKKMSLAELNKNYGMYKYYGNEERNGLLLLPEGYVNKSLRARANYF